MTHEGLASHQRQSRTDDPMTNLCSTTTDHERRLGCQETPVAQHQCIGGGLGGSWRVIRLVMLDVYWLVVIKGWYWSRLMSTGSLMVDGCLILFLLMVDGFFNLAFILVNHDHFEHLPWRSDLCWNDSLNKAQSPKRPWGKKSMQSFIERTGLHWVKLESLRDHEWQ